MRYALLLAFVVGCGHHGDGVVGGGGGATAPDAAADAPAPDAPTCVTGTSQGCPTGEYCTDGTTCVAGCGSDSDCGSATGCCDHACAALDTLTDCGACGNACGSGDFCDGTECKAPTYPNFCANKTVYVIHDGITADNTAGDLMASTITANCPADVVVHTADQTDATLVDQTTGQPLGGGGVTYVLGGGPFPNKPLKWLEQTQQVTPIYFDAPDGINYDWKKRSDASVVASMVASTCSAHADQFISELVTDPMSGTLSLVGYGACSGSRGTDAAAYFYANVMLPNTATYPDSWYVFSWADTNGDSTPNDGDTFTVLAHGL